MRIRTIKPEFWRSDDIDALCLADRLLFIGLWSYVDDHGVGVDKESAIAADLFAADLQGDPHECSVRIHGGLNRLSDAGLIQRYTVDGKRYLHVTSWERHQRINKPTPSKHPAPTSENAVPTGGFTEDSRNPPEIPVPGTGEPGNRGTGEKDTSAATANTPDEPDPFDTFWTAYPRKDNKQTARKAWTKAAKQHGPDKLLEEIHRWSGLWEQAGIEKRFIPHAATWLNGQRWEDEPPPPRLKAVSGDPEDWTDAPRIPWWQQ